MGLPRCWCFGADTGVPAGSSSPWWGEALGFVRAHGGEDASCETLGWLRAEHSAPGVCKVKRSLAVSWFPRAIKPLQINSRLFYLFFQIKKA